MPRPAIYTLFALVLVLSGCLYKNPSVRATELVEPDPSDPALSAPIEFRLGAGDVISISIWRQTEFSLQDARVDETGNLMHPVLGDIPVAGKTVREIRDDVAERCREYLVNPKVSISVEAMQSQKLIVLGEVNSPQVFSMAQPLTVLEVLSRCGGCTERARPTHVMVLRRQAKDKTVLMRVDTVKLLASGAMDRDLMMRSGDILYVPSSVEADMDEFFRYLETAMNAIRGVQSNITLWPEVREVLETGEKKSVTPTTIGL